MAGQIDLRAIPVDAAAPATPYVQASLINPEVKDVFEALIVAIRRQLSPGVPTAGGVTGAFNYKADTNEDSMTTDPGTGRVRWNNSDQLAATQLSFDWLTSDGFDPVLYFKLMNVPQKFAVQDKDLHVNYQIWTLSAPVIEMMDWFIVPVTLDSFGGTGKMSNNAQVTVLL